VKGRKGRTCGTHSAYQGGCRCDECRGAHRKYQNERRWATGVSKKYDGFWQACAEKYGLKRHDVFRVGVGRLRAMSEEERDRTLRDLGPGKVRRTRRKVKLVLPVLPAAVRTKLHVDELMRLATIAGRRVA
jgi:hypothetical protein